MSGVPEQKSEPWVYPLGFGDTLATNDWIEWHVHRFLGSAFLARMKYLDRRDVIGVAVELWSKAYLEDPAGTLPDDDVQLSDKAGFGVDVARWQEMRPLALWGWSPVLIDDQGVPVAGRLGHRRIAVIALDSWRRKDGRATAREGMRLAGVKHKVRKRLHDLKRKPFAENDRLCEEVAKHLMAAGLWVTDDNVLAALETLHGIPRVVNLKGGASEG
jgi:hypothetical protein